MQDLFFFALSAVFFVGLACLIAAAGERGGSDALEALHDLMMWTPRA